MIRNPLTRRRRSPVDQVLDAVDGVRSEAVAAAGTVRDAAAKTADALGEATPSPFAKARIPLAGAALAAAIGIALAIRARAKSNGVGSDASPPTYPTAVETAARTTGRATPGAKTAEASGVSKAPAEAGKSAAQVEPEPEQPAEPKAKTTESEAVPGESDKSA